MVNAEHHRGVSGHVATETLNLAIVQKLWFVSAKAQPWTAL